MSPINKQDREKMMEKVKKLLALATSPNEHEALLAATRAKEIMAKYNLSMGEITEQEMQDLSEVMEEILETDFEKKFPGWVGIISAGICLLYRCEHYSRVSKSGHATRTGNFRVIKKFKLVFVGAKEDVSAAAYVLGYILRSCDSWAKEYYRTSSSQEEKDNFRRKQIYKNYNMGMAQRVYQRLKEEAHRLNRMEEEDPNCRALVIRKDQNIKDHLEDLDLQKSRPQKVNPFSDAFQAGAEAGDRINIGASNGAKLQAPQGRISHK